ncbi:MAG TPA: SLC13 family permease [Streptosporangiaceae bacterium]
MTTSTVPSARRLDRKQTIAVVCFGVSVAASIVLAVLGDKPGIWGLVPIVLYAVLALLGVDVVLATVAAVLIATIMTRTAPIALGEQLATSMGSLVAVIGLVILLGTGLGQVAQETGAAQTLVRMLMSRIGLSTKTRVQFGIMISALLLVGTLGTMIGGNALLAPIVIPIAARVGWRPPAVAAMFHACGSAGLMMGPFTPPVVTITAAAHLSYGSYFLHAGLPVGVVTLASGFFMARWIQKRTDQEYSAEDTAGADNGGLGTATAASRRAAIAFVTMLLVAAVYGVVMQAGYAYTLVVMIATAAVTGLAGGHGPLRTLQAVYTGAGRQIWLFFLFVLLDPMLTLVEKTGAFDSIFGALKPIMPSVGPWVFLVLVVLLGYVHAVPGAAVAQVVLINKLFGPLLAPLGVPPTAWAVAMLGTSQIDQLGPYPTADMVGQMGIARSRDLRMMLFNGWAAMAANTALFLVLFWVLL